ncbi:MAG: M20/M25/M40 family metallo-hydrolase [Cyclobacteriaceae bacterium]|nr:M20/M25/M40 family metallo-hydrolase [Cyclobacteriaceae bacterium]
MKKLLYVALLFLAVGAMAQEKMDTATVSKIKKEGFNNSQVMDIMSMLTDVYGPRLMNSPNYQKAADYAKATMEKWGLSSVQYDTWDEHFGRGWEIKKFSLQVIEPSATPLIAYPKAWSPGIKGAVQAEVVFLDVKSEADLDKYKGKLKGKIVLFNNPILAKSSFKPDATRLNDSTLLVMSNSSGTQTFRARRFNNTAAPQNFTFMKWDLCQKEGVVAVLESSPAFPLEDGTLTVSGATVPYPATTPFDQRKTVRSAEAPKILPQISVSAEQYARMVRQLQKGQKVKVELALETAFTPSAPGFNIIAEIPGTDLKDEVVMIGAHFDSWHSGTGATDNAAGSAVCMEAMRILKQMGISPRRTIRIGLWGGEEQGLLGSRNYVKRKLGERLDKAFPYDSIKLTAEGQKLSLYLNMDNGTGKFRGVYLQGNENARKVFREWLKPFNKLGASTLTLNDTGGTDHLSFDAIGLPGFQFIQDPISYDTRTHHTNFDVYDKIIEADMKHNAVMMAAFAWLAAQRDEMFPRK